MDEKVAAMFLLLLKDVVFYKYGGMFFKKIIIYFFYRQTKDKFEKKSSLNITLKYEDELFIDTGEDYFSFLHFSDSW